MAVRKAKKQAATGAAYTNVLLEQMRSEQRAMFGAMNAWGERLERKFDARFEQVDQRLGNLEAAVLQNSRDIKQNTEDIRRLASELADLREEVRRLRNDFDTREEKARIAALEARVTELERRVKTG